MGKITNNLVKKADTFVTQLLTDKLPNEYDYHSVNHTREVVDNAEMIGEESGLSEDEINIVKICAWFHDTGFIYKPIDNEKDSAKIAKDFLTANGIDEKVIAQVVDGIMATCIPQTPNNIVDRVLCDADLKHLSDDNYIERIENLRNEMISISGKKLSMRKFHIMSEKFFKQHNYYTDYGKKELQPKKEKNLQLIQKAIYMLEQEKEREFLDSKPKKTKSQKYSRGVESMIRVTARNQISLSSIADNKSNILISVNAIIMSVSMTVLVSRFEETPNIILPTLIFLVFCLITIVIAILSTRPNISSGTFSKEDIKQNKVNLLFFGNFYNMELDEYEWAIAELMKNDEHLYSTMIKDQYSLGKVLAKKYKLLRIAYNVFMVGIIISVLSFVLAFTTF